MTDRPTPTLMRHGRRGDGLMATFHLADPNRFAAIAQQRAQEVQLAHLHQILQAVDPMIFAPVQSAVAAERQAREVRASADRQERQVLLGQAELKRVQGDLRMPGVEKLNRERQVGEQLDRDQQQVARLKQAAQTLEGRAANYRAEADRLYQQIANEANQRAAGELVAHAKGRIDQWASLMPAEYLFTEEYCGMAGVGYLTGELSRLRPGEPQARAGGLAFNPPAPAGSFAGPANQEAPDPMARFPRVEGLDGRGCRVVYQDFPLGAEALVARSIRELTQPGWRVQATLLGDDRFRVTATQIGHQPPGQDTNQKPATWGPPEWGPDQTAPARLGNVDEMVADRRPARIEYPPFQAEWPPPDADNGVEALGPQVGTFDGGEVSVGPGEGYDPGGPPALDPYTVAQEAIRAAQQAIRRGVVPQVPVSAAATDAAATTGYDQTNGGWNGAATPQDAVNGTPFAASDVDAALGGLFGGGLGGPAVELDPNEMPI